MFPAEEAIETLAIQGLKPQEKALLELRQILKGLVEDFGTILIGISLHPMIERQRERCLRLGIPNNQVTEAIDEYRRTS